MVMPALRIGPKRPLRVFLAEHREARQPPLTQEQIGQRFHPPVEKGQISKWETAGRKGQISTAVVAEYAEALGLDDPRLLYYLPAKPSLDAIAAKAKLDDATKEHFAGLISAYGQRKRG